MDAQASHALVRRPVALRTSLRSSRHSCCPHTFARRCPQLQRWRGRLRVHAGISANDIRIGTTVEMEGAPWKVIEFLHVKPGKGAAFVRSKLRNFLNGNVVDKTFRGSDNIEAASLSKRDTQFTYSDGNEYVFMDTTTYEEVRLTRDAAWANYLAEGQEARLLVWQDQVISVDLPKQVELAVQDCDPGVKGNTVSGGTKPAKLSSGVEVQVPLFIEVGDRIKLDTTTGAYMGKAMLRPQKVEELSHGQSHEAKPLPSSPGSLLGRFTTVVAEGIPAQGDRPAIGPTYRNTISANSWPSIEGVTTLHELFEASVKRFGSNSAVGWRPVAENGEAGSFSWLTYAQMHERVEQLAAGLTALGVKARGRLGIFSANTVEWPLVQYAAYRTATSIVPVYDTLGAEATEYIMSHASVELVFVHGNKLASLAKALEKTPSVKKVVWWGKQDAGSLAAIEKRGVKVLTFKEVVELGKAQPKGAGSSGQAPSPSDPACIMYTSGTTGNPKGVVIKHSQLVAATAGMSPFIKQGNITVGPGDATLSYLPLAHIIAQALEVFFLSVGAKIGYWQGDIKKITEDVGALRPTIFVAVPRVLDKMASAIRAKVEGKGFVAQTLFGWGLAAKLGALQAGSQPEQAGRFWDALVFRKVQATFGGRVRYIVSGGAPLAPHTQEFMQAALSCPVIQGYGLTETTGSSFLEMDRQRHVRGSVGAPSPATEFRLQGVPDMGYDPLAAPPRGEICIRGPMVFDAYYEDPEKTKEAVDEGGWFHSGDVGEVTPEGTLKIVDRIKNMFKLGQGEYVAAEALEAKYKDCPLVEQVWVYGNSFECFVVCVVVPKEEALLAWAKGQGLQGKGFPDVCADPKASEHVLGELQKSGRAKGLKGFEIVKAVHLSPEEFSVENDLMTASFKMKRNQLLKHFQKAVDAMYESAKAKGN